MPSPSPFSYAPLQPRSHRHSPSVPSSPFELDKSQVHPSLISYLNQEPPRNVGSSSNVTGGGDGGGGRFFSTQPHHPLEGQTSGHLVSQPMDRREYGGRGGGGGGGMSRGGMMGLNPNSGIHLYGGSEGYFNTPQLQQRTTTTTTTAPGTYITSNTNVLGGYPNAGGYGYLSNTHMGLPGEQPTYTFRTSGGGGMNVMDPAGVVEMGLSSESGMDAGWLTFMRDCGIMDVTEDAYR